MKIYQTLEAIPGRVIGLLNVLRRHGDGWVERTLILDLMQPAPIRSGPDAGMALDVISAAVELGVVIEDRTEKSSIKLRLADKFVIEDDGSFEKQLPLLLAEAALTEECQGRSNQFTRVCAWLLLQDPLAMPQGHAEMKSKLERDSLELEELGLRNDSRWDNLLYWTTYLGLTWQTTERKCTGVIPDPSTYLLRNLETLLPGWDPVPVQEFRSRLGALCPALDGGRVHKEVASTMRGSSNRAASGADRLSAALTLALRHLKISERVEYWCPNDQRTFLLMSDDEKIAFVRRGTGGNP